MRKLGLVVVLLGLLLELVPRGYYAALAFEVIDQPSDLDAFESVNKVMSLLGFVGVVGIVLGVLLVLVARAPSARPASGASFGAPGPYPGGPSAPGSAQNPPPPGYLS